MRAVEDTHFAKQDYRHSASFALRDLGSKNLEQSFDVLPYDVRAGWTRIDRLECALMTALHVPMVPRVGTMPIMWR